MHLGMCRSITMHRDEDAALRSYAGTFAFAAVRPNVPWFIRMHRRHIRMHRNLMIDNWRCTCTARFYASLPTCPRILTFACSLMSSASFRVPTGAIDPNTERCPYCQKPYKKRGYHQHVEACRRKHTQALEDLQLREQLEQAQTQGMEHHAWLYTRAFKEHWLIAQVEDFERLQLSLGMTSQAGGSFEGHV